MKKVKTQSSILLGLLTISSFTYANTPIIMGYYENWDTYQNFPMPGNAQSATNPDLTTKLTGINTLAYAFAEVLTEADANLAGIPAAEQNQYIGTVRFSDVWSDLNSNNVNDAKFCEQYAYSCGTYNYKQNKFIAWPASGVEALGNFQAFVNTKVTNHILSIGGADHEDSWEAAIQNPQNFVDSLQALVNAYGFNGVDLDYEPTTGIPSQYVQGFVNLIKQIRQTMPNLMITWPIVPNQTFINALSQSQWQTVAQNLNYISVMGYDMSGEFSVPQVTGLQSALMAPPPGAFNDNDTIKALNAVGISNSQIIMGAPLYGRAVGGVQAAGLGQTFTSAVQGDLDTSGCSTTPGLKTSCGGMMSYTSLLAAGYTPTEVNVGSAVIGAYTYDPNKQLFVSYDSPASIAAKANYVINNNLAGIMVWALRFDASTDSPNSLLAAMDKPFGITPDRPTVGQVIVVNNNQGGLGIDHALNVILQEGNGPLYQQPTVTVGNIPATQGQNSVLQYPAAFGAYNGELSIWAQDTAVSGSQYVQCSTPSVNYSQTGKQITVYVVENGNNIDCSSWYSGN